MAQICIICALCQKRRQSVSPESKESAGCHDTEKCSEESINTSGVSKNIHDDIKISYPANRSENVQDEKLHIVRSRAEINSGANHEVPTPADYQPPFNDEAVVDQTKDKDDMLAKIENLTKRMAILESNMS